MKRKICMLTLALLCLLPTLCTALLPVGAAPENLVRGMEYTIQTGVPTVHSYDRYEESDDVDKGQLTDGIKARGGTADPAWYHVFRSQSRLVTFDFGEPVSVSGFSAGFYHGGGYYAPRYVRLRLSENGEDWFTAGETEPPFSLNESARPYEASLTLKKAYAARYVQIEFCSDIFACCDEIEVYGSRTCSGNELTFTPDEPQEGSFCTSLGDTYGITDIIKMYNGYFPSNQDFVRNTVEKLLPYVAYLSKDGQVQDTMFDAVAFVPCVATNFAYPSGGTLVKTSKYPSAVQSDWIFYTDFLFEKGYELDALNTAVGQVYEQLGITGKFPILLTMPYPGVTDKPFGDVDGDGVSDYCKTVSERVAAINWYDGYLTQRFAEANFSNLDFVGYYWYEEELNYTWSADEKAFTVGAVQVLEDAGKVVLFDPFYLSTGFDHWQELGFEGAVMQPNVAFTDSRSYFELDMLWEFAETANTYHLGVEVETNEPGFFQGEQAAEAMYNYERYLYVGYKSGYMNALHTFYQGAGPGTLYTFCHADSLQMRRMYDITYQFIKGTYKNEPPAVTLPEQQQAYANRRNELDLSIQDGDSFGGDLTVTVSGCEHGRAQVTATRSALIYVPEDGYTGTDTITLTVDDKHNEKATYTVTVNVVEAPEGFEPSKPGASSDSAATDSQGEDGGLPGWVIPVILAAALVLVGVAVFAVVKRNRKQAK